VGERSVKSFFLVNIHTGEVHPMTLIMRSPTDLRFQEKTTDLLTYVGDHLHDGESLWFVVSCVMAVLEQADRQ
jgi:hypothetical protein